VPPVEVGGRLFEHCVDQFSLIMMGFAQTGPTVISMTKTWCGMQSAVNSWVGKAPQGRPDWDFRDCNNMVTLLAFALRDDIAEGNSQEAMGALNVCKRLFLALGPVHRVEQLVKDAWSMNARSLGSLTLTTADKTSEEDRQRVLQAVQDYAGGLAGQLRGQRDAYSDVNKGMMDVSSFA